MHAVPTTSVGAVVWNTDGTSCKQADKTDRDKTEDALLSPARPSARKELEPNAALSLTTNYDETHEEETQTDSDTEMIDDSSLQELANNSSRYNSHF